MGAVISIDERALPGALEKLERNIRRAISRGALAGAHRGRALMVKKTPVDQGQLKAGWKVDPGKGDFDGLVTVLATLKNTSPTVSMVELGARPHGMSPEGWQAIYNWVSRHARTRYGIVTIGGDGSRYRSKKSAAEFGGVTPYHGPDPVISQITNAIVERIRREGVKPRLFIRHALNELRNVMMAEVERALERVNGGGQ